MPIGLVLTTMSRWSMMFLAFFGWVIPLWSHTYPALVRISSFFAEQVFNWETMFTSHFLGPPVLLGGLNGREVAHIVRSVGACIELHADNGPL